MDTPDNQYKSVDELIGLLQVRQLICPDRDTLIHALETIGHYRLREYYAAFRDPEKRFRAEVSIADIVRLYAFDRRLKLLMLGPLEKLEVALRSLIVKGMGDYLRRKTPAEPAVFHLLDERFYTLRGATERFHFETLGKMCRRDADRKWARLPKPRQNPDVQGESRSPTQQARRAAFEKIYAAMPAWELVHMMSFGPLVSCFRLLKPEITESISAQFQLAPNTLRSMLFALKNIRNACARHEPVWNWNAQWSRMQFPKNYAALAEVTETNIKTIYTFCAAIHILLAYLSQGKSTWYRRLKKLGNEFDHLNTGVMGFPPDWQTKAFWSTPDVRTIGRVGLMKSHMSQYRPVSDMSR